MDFLVHEGICFLLTLNVLIAEQETLRRREGLKRALLPGSHPFEWTSTGCWCVLRARTWCPKAVTSLPTYSHQVVRPKPSSLPLQMGVFLHRSPLLVTYFGNTAKTTLLQSYSNVDLPSASQCHHCWVSTESHRRQERTKKGNVKRAMLERTIRLGAQCKKKPHPPTNLVSFLELTLPKFYMSSVRVFY